MSRKTHDRVVSQSLWLFIRLIDLRLLMLAVVISVPFIVKIGQRFDADLVRYAEIWLWL